MLIFKTDWQLFSKVRYVYILNTFCCICKDKYMCETNQRTNKINLHFSTSDPEWNKIITLNKSGLLTYVLQSMYWGNDRKGRLAAVKF
jgi:hypothetical protein